MDSVKTNSRGTERRREAVVAGRFRVIYWVTPWLALLLSTAPLAGKTITVTSAGHAGAGTLRQAILDAAAGDTINFSLPSGATTIILTDQLLINKNLTITGPGANLLSVVRGRAQGQPFFKFRIFEIDSGNVTISGLTISNGFPVQDNTGKGGEGDALPPGRSLSPPTPREESRLPSSRFVLLGSNRVDTRRISWRCPAD